VPSLPDPLFTLSAPPPWRAIDFLSDLHLAPGMDATLAALHAHLRDTPADAVVLLGDIFEVWVGDDARQDEFEQRCCSLLREASSRLQLFFIAGNRDFLLGEAMAADCGLTLLPDPCCLRAFGRQLLISHGDALCLDDVDYQRFRAEVRQPLWQQRFLAQPLAQRREIARHLRAESEARKRSQTPEQWSDLDAEACRAWLAGSGCQVLLHGHTHRPMVHELGDSLQRWVLSDWDLDAATPRGDVLRLSAAGLQRIAITAPC
jgi:UDP-2,3-diacylglucosamine hydrolase